MIAIEVPRVGLVSAAISDLRWSPADSRSVCHHLDVVWCNYADGFVSAEEFLAKVCYELPGTEVGRLAKTMLENHVRTELCR